MASDPQALDPELPAIDDHLADLGYEVWDGKRVYVAPARKPHGERHVQLAALVEAHAGDAYSVAADLLTRTSHVDDIAPDVSVYPAAPDPKTGGRQIQELAFEIVSKQRLSRAGDKARKLANRGVHRVFAIEIKRSRALEWSRSADNWVELDPSGLIEDPSLEVPLRIEEMIHAVRSNNAVARALIARRNPVIEAVRNEGRVEGKLEGMLEALVALCAVRGIALDAAARDRITRERDPAQLDRWIVRAATAATLDDVLGA